MGTHTTASVPSDCIGFAAPAQHYYGNDCFSFSSPSPVLAAVARTGPAFAVGTPERVIDDLPGSLADPGTEAPGRARVEGTVSFAVDRVPFTARS